MLSYKEFIWETVEKIVAENESSTNIINAVKQKYSRFDSKDLSANRFTIYVPARDRMRIAAEIEKDFDGALVKQGSSAGKPVVDLPGGVRVFVKPIPGSGVGGTAKEDAQLKSLQQQMEKALSDDDSVEIAIKIGSRVYNVAGAATTPGTPKSDFHLLDASGREVVWISHKDGSSPKDFQQWSGMSARTEREIYKHRETQKFIEDVRAITGSTMPRATTLSRAISDPRLVNLAVYGNQFGKSLGRQNVTLLLQGPVRLVKKSGFYQLESNHTLVNGERVTGGYQPVFMAIYKGDRSNFGIAGARFAIQPKDSRKSREI